MRTVQGVYYSLEILHMEAYYGITYIINDRRINL